MGNTNCPVCKTPIGLQTRFCPTCKFERHIFPDGVSKEVQAEENLRIEKAHEFYELYVAAKSAADNAKAAADKEMQSKLDEANEALEDEKKAHNKTKTALKNEKKAHEETESDLEKEKTDHEETRSNLAKEQTAHNKTKAALKKEKTDHEETMSDLEDEKTAHERTKSNLAKEQTAHNRTKDALKYEEAAHKETKSDLANEQEAHKQTKKALDDLKKNPQTPPHPVQTPPPGPDKKVIGKVLFTQAGRSEAVDLYEGGCRVTAPAWTNVKGELFEIKCDNGMYFLRDLSGRMYNRHERKISPLVTVSNKDAFRIGELIIRLSFPKQ